jgi:hypothetical protein
MQESSRPPEISDADPFSSRQRSRRSGADRFAHDASDTWCVSTSSVAVNDRIESNLRDMTVVPRPVWGARNRSKHARFQRN